MEESTIWKRTFAWTGALLGLSVAWVGVVCLGSLLVVGSALPGPTEGSSPAAKPASSHESPTKAPQRDDSVVKNRNG